MRIIMLGVRKVIVESVLFNLDLTVQFINDKHMLSHWKGYLQ